jgi:hypothetical protein
MSGKSVIFCVGISLFIQLLMMQAGFSQVKGGIHFHAFADNREYQYQYQYPQTIFGFRFTPYLSKTIDSVHYFRAGINTLYEFGGAITSKNFTPEIYYNYKGKTIDFKFGSFPRRDDMAAYSLLLLTDTLLYFRPTVQGLMAKYKKSRLSLKFWLDWVSRQTEKNKEQFLFGLVARYQIGSVFAENQFSMLHDAFASVRTPNDVLHDNGANILKLGFEKEKILKLDKLTVSFGWVSGYQRARALNHLETPDGLINELLVEKKWFIFKNTFYSGDGFNQIYGDKFYRSKKYNRSDFKIRFFRESRVSCLFTYSLHRIEKKWDNQQALQLFFEM